MTSGSRQIPHNTLPAPAVTLRSLPAKRASRLRFSWFVLGTVFGGTLMYFISAIMHNEEYGKQFKASAVYSVTSALLLHPVPAQPQPAALVKTAHAEGAHHAPATARAAVALALPASLNLSVRRGDTLSSLLMAKGVPENEAHQIVLSMKKVYNPKRLTVGQSMQLHLDKSRNDASRPSVTALSISVSPIKTVILSRDADDGFMAREVQAQIYNDVARGGGTIRSSLYQTGVDSGVPAQLISEVINAFSYDVDFQRDIKEGDSIDIVYERKHTAKDVTTGHGNVLYAALVMGDRNFTIYRHTSADGYTGYYNAKGESVRKSLLKTPINGAHITSGFGMRMHPLLGYSKMHKGIDFGAAMGTPIYAAGDGTVAFAGRKGGYGNYVQIKHNATYATAYGHASRIARGIRHGVHVRQGQVIAYVGSTGRSTGPHLHYEILVGGTQVNPSGVKFRTGQTLAGREMAQFRHETHKVQVALETLPRKTQVASLER